MSVISAHEKPVTPPGDVTVYFDDGTRLKPYPVHPGTWQVSALKNLFEVAAAKALAEITEAGVNDLPDDGHVKVFEGQKFMAHVRSGGAS